MSEITLEVQSKPRKERHATYFCRLCRDTGIKSRKAHLKNYHKVDPITLSNKSTKDIVDVIFLLNC